MLAACVRYQPKCPSCKTLCRLRGTVQASQHPSVLTGTCLVVQSAVLLLSIPVLLSFSKMACRASPVAR